MLRSMIRNGALTHNRIMLRQPSSLARTNVLCGRMMTLTRISCATVAGLAALLAVGIMPEEAEAQAKQPPYWASISANEARMRVGPSEDYPANWVYRRRDLPVRVVQVHGNWRKVEDPAGTQGWMHVRLLSDTATGIVNLPGGEMFAKPDEGSSLIYHVEAGVVGRLSDCAKGWCVMDVAGQRGYIRAGSLWGAAN